MQTRRSGSKRPNEGADLHPLVVTHFAREESGKPQFGRVMRCNMDRGIGVSSRKLIEASFANQ